MDNNTELVLFNSDDGKVSLPVTVENETVWLSLDQILNNVVFLFRQY